MKKFLLGLIFIIAVSFAGDIKPNGISQGDLYTLLNNLVIAQNYKCLGDTGVTPSATGATLNVTTTTNYINSGLNYSLTPSSSVSIVAGNSTSQSRSKFSYSATNPSNYYGVHINGSGRYYFNDSRTNYYAPAVSGYTCIAQIKVTLTSANTAGFTLGTTAWSAASQNYTVYDTATLTSGKNKVSLTGL